MLTLPPNIAAEFKLEVKQIEAGQSMKCITSFERDAKQEQALLMVTQLLNRRLGNIDQAELNRVGSLSVEQLQALNEALLDFTSVTDLTDWLSQV